MVTLPARYDPVRFAERMLDVELFPWQQDFLRRQATLLLNSAHAGRGSGVVACCGRQAGKTTANAVSLLWYATAWPGTQQFVVAPIAPQSKLIWSECTELLHDSVLAASFSCEVRQADYPHISITVGGSTSRIAFRSVGLDGGRLRGPHANRIFGDEAARIAGGVFEGDLVPMMSAQEHRQLVLTSTPLFIGDYFHTCWQRGETDANWAGLQYPSTANPRISSALLDELAATMSEEAFAVEYLAEWVDGAGSYFPWALIQQAIDPGIRPGSGRDRRYVIGYDQAQRRDRSGVAVLDCTSTDPMDEPWRIVEVFDAAPHHEPWPEQAKTVAGLAQRYNRAPIVLDATHNPAMADLLKAAGAKVRDYRFTASPTQKAELYDQFKAALEQGTLRLPVHEDLERELRFIRRDVSERGRVSLGAPARAGMFDDLATAAMLALSGARARPECGILFADMGNGGRPPRETRPSTFQERLHRGHHSTPTGRPWALIGYDE
jgi:hypothetical protein